MWLVTNDDGPSALGLGPAIQFASEIGEVAAVRVPRKDMSNCSRGHFGSGVELGRSLLDGTAVEIIDQSPATIVLRTAIEQSRHQRLFTGCVAGVNTGLNVGSDLMISGTFGAACEAASLGAIGIAISAEEELFGSDRRGDLHDMLDAISSHVAPRRGENALQGLCLNVNLPREWSGRVAYASVSSHTIYPAEWEESPAGFRVRHHVPPRECLEDNSDIVAVCYEKTISVSVLDFRPGSRVMGSTRPDRRS